MVCDPIHREIRAVSPTQTPVPTGAPTATAPQHQGGRSGKQQGEQRTGEDTPMKQ